MLELDSNFRLVKIDQSNDNWTNCDNNTDNHLTIHYSSPYDYTIKSNHPTLHTTRPSWVFGDTYNNASTSRIQTSEKLNKGKLSYKNVFTPQWRGEASREERNGKQRAQRSGHEGDVHRVRRSVLRSTSGARTCRRARAARGAAARARARRASPRARPGARATRRSGRADRVREQRRRRTRHAVRGGGGRWVVRHGRDGSEGLGRLSVRGRGAVGEGVDARDGDVVRVADFKRARGRGPTEGVLGRAVVREADSVEGVLAVALRVRA